MVIIKKGWGFLTIFLIPILYKSKLGGVLRVTGIVIKNGIGNPSSIPGWDYVLLNTNASLFS